MTQLEVKYITKSAPVKLNSNAKESTDKFWQLRGISFTVNAGESIGIIGMDASSKTLLLKIIAGKIRQTTGFITTSKHINYAAVDELNGNFSGEEYIKQVLKQAQIDDIESKHLENAITSFSELGQWIFQPVNEYSLAMKARLSLTIALFIQPDVILIDELLAVLDQPFYQKVAQKIQSLKDTGTSFLISDNRLLNIERFCERTMWLAYGKIQDFGATSEILKKFEFAQEWYNALTLPEQNQFHLDKQIEQLKFNVYDIYEKFKVEQFKYGYTRKDEAKMKNAFFVKHGENPVKKKNSKTVVKEESKKVISNSLTLLLTSFVFFFLASIWYGYNRYAQAKKDTQRTESIFKAVGLHAKKVSSSISQVKLNESLSLKKVEDDKKVSEENQKKSEEMSKASEEQKIANTQTISVSNGDTLETLAQKYSTTVENLRDINGISDNQIKAGDTIRVPK